MLLLMTRRTVILAIKLMWLSAPPFTCLVTETEHHLLQRRVLMVMMVRVDGDDDYGDEDHGDDIQSNHPQRVLTEAPPHFLTMLKKNCISCSGSLPKITR